MSTFAIYIISISLKLIMSALLITKAQSLSHSINIIDVDYSDCGTCKNIAEINFNKARGSVRLMMKNVLLPADVEKARKKVLRNSYQ